MLVLDQSLVFGILRNWLEGRFQNITVFVNMFCFWNRKNPYGVLFDCPTENLR